MPSTTEAKILDAAKKVFTEHGLYGARMQDIANLAGINKALLHYYFRNKERLFDEVFGGALKKYFQNMEALSDVEKSIPERLILFSERFIDFLAEYPQMSLFLLKEMSANEALFHAKVKGIKSEKHQSIIQVLAQHDKKHPDPVMFMIQLHSMCAYPFLAAPILKVIIEKSGNQWSDSQHIKLKAAVRQFILQELS